MARYVTATLVKRQTADGLIEVEDYISIGKTYEVDLDRIETAEFFNTSRSVEHTKEIIWCRDGGWFATELLTIPKEKVHD